MRLSAIAETLTDCRLDATEDPEILGIAPLSEAAAGDITYLWASKFMRDLSATRASAVILDDSTPTVLPALRSARPRLLFARVLALLNPNPPVSGGVHPTALVPPCARLGKNVTLGAGVVLGERVELGNEVVIHPNSVLYDDVVVGDATVIHAQVVVREHTRIGKHCVIFPGAVLGGDGFGFELQADGTWFKIPQTGEVILEDHVEIGCLSAVDKPALGTTRVRSGAKIDNLVQVGHGCDIGNDSLLVSQVGLAGGVRMGHHVVLAGQVGVADHVTIGAGVTVGAKSGIPGDVEAGATLMGYPVVPAAEWKRMVVAERRLPGLLRMLNDMQKRIEALERNLAEAPTQIAPADAEDRR